MHNTNLLLAYRFHFKNNFQSHYISVSMFILKTLSRLYGYIYYIRLYILYMFNMSVLKPEGLLGELKTYNVFRHPVKAEKLNFNTFIYILDNQKVQVGKDQEKRFPLRKPRWEKTKVTIRHLYHETYRKPNEQLFSQ